MDREVGGEKFEEQRQNDRRAGGEKMPGGIEDDAGERAGQRRGDGEGDDDVELAAQEVGGDTGEDQQRGDQQAAGDGDADDDGDGDENHQQVMYESAAHTGRLGHERIEAVGEDFLAQQGDDENDGCADGNRGEGHVRTELRGLTEEDLIERGRTFSGVDMLEDMFGKKSEGERGDEKDADGGVAGDAVAVGEISDRQRPPRQKTTMAA